MRISIKSEKTVPPATSRQRKGYAVLLVLLMVAGCTASRPQPILPHDGLVRWAAVDSINALLPGDMRLYAGVNAALPLRAWMVLLPSRYPVRVEVSDDTSDVRETTSSFARDAGACVAVNGGYFRMGDFPASAVGLLVQNDSVTAEATTSQQRDSIAVDLARAAFGRMPDGRYEIGWVVQRGDTLLLLDAPLQPGQQVEGPSRTARLWTPIEAMGAGPMLVRAGRLHVTSDEEGFGSTSIPNVHPRTAAGVTAAGDLILMVVDGRQDASRGVDLEELGRLMLEAGAVEALNLDGGGSSTLVVQGRLINRPTGGTFERQVMNALVAFCE